MRKRRILSILMAVCMLVSGLLAGLTLNGNIISVYASNEDTVKIPFVLNFDDLELNTTPTGWVESASNASEDAGKSSMLVVAEGENKVAKLSQTEACTSDYNIHYFFEEADRVVLEYRFKIASGSKTIFLPTLAYNDANQSRPLYMKTAGNSFSYSANGWTWTAAKTLSPDTWHTLKLEVDLSQDVRKLYINGEPIALGAEHMAKYPCNTKLKINNVATGFYSKSTIGDLYVDDLKVSNYVDYASIPLELDFEDSTVNATPTDWSENANNANEDAEKSSMLVVSDGENNVAKLSQTAKRTSDYYMHYYFEETDKAVLEYRFKVETGSKAWLPSLAYNNARPTMPLYLMLDGTNVQYSVNCSTWENAVIGLSSDSWHTLKVVVDLSQNLRDLYVDGEWIKLNPDHMAKAACKTDLKINNVAAGFYSKSTTGTFYIDDVAVQTYVAGENVTFEKTEVEIPVGASVILNPSFTPVDTSVQGIAYTSSDSSIAMVSANGVITAIKEGNATITATPALEALRAVEIKVTVAGEVEGSITVEPSELSLPVGGHTYLDTSLTLAPGITADNTMEYVSANPDVATVDEWGEVLAVAAGTTTITIKSVANSNIQKVIPVVVSEPTTWKTIYVSVDGTEDGASADTPTTLQGAIEQLAGINKDDMTGNIEIVLADGYYYQTETIELNDAHGGNNLYSVVFKAEDDGDDEQPIIGGGIHINGSNYKDNTNGVYVYNLAELGFTVQTRQLFVDGVRATRARSQGTLINPEYLYDENGTNIGLICENTELLSYTRPEDLELISYHEWVHQRCQVAEIKLTDDNKVALVMDQPGWDIVAASSLTHIAMEPGTIKYYENALELLDEGGEWYLDDSNQKLYYMPRLWEEMNNVEITIPVLDGEIFTIIGTSSDQQVQNICFDGITFADTTWMRPSGKNGHAAQQNNYLRDTDHDSEEGNMMVDAAITVKKANSVNFLNCTFTRLGINAINMLEGVQNSLVYGSHFYDISGNALAIGGPNYRADVDNYNPTDINKMMKNIDALNNYIHDIGVDYHSSSAISVGFAANVDFCYNEIFNVPYSGFHLGYGWNIPFENVTKNMKLSNNFIHDYMFDGVYDGGDVYTNGNTGKEGEETVNIFSENYIRNQGEKVGPLYADQGTTNWYFIDNVVDTSENEMGPHSLTAIPWGRVNKGGGNILMAGNYTSSHRYSGGDPDLNIVFRDNILVEDLNWPQEALDIIANSGLQASYSYLRNNQAERIITSIPEDGLGLKAGSTFNIQVTATDGKDRAVSLENAIVRYEIAGESAVAEVSDEGVIKALTDGQASVRIYVVSNGILDIIERDVYVGDEITELRLRDVEGNISLYSNSKDMQLDAYAVTETGREVEFETVTWFTEDTGIAVVDENGCLKAVAVGETYLNVTGETGGYTKSGKFKVIIKEPLVAEIDYLEEMFEAENADKWVGATPYSWELIDGEKITGELNGFKTYAGTTYQNELLTFRMSLDAVGTWPSIVLRAQSTETGVALGASGYIICMGDKGLQVQRFNGNTRTVFYGTVSGFTPMYGPDIYPHALSDRAYHEIQIGALNEEDGVRLVMYIDGEEVYNCLDTGEDAIKEAGYFGMIGYKDTFVLEKMSASSAGYTAGLNSLTSEVTIGETVNVNVSVSHAEDAVFAAGEVVVTYDSEKLTFNKEKSTLNGAIVTEDPAGTLTLEDYGKDKNFGNAVYVLAFDAKADGEAEVKITSAAFVNKEKAVKSDLIAATISPASVTVTVNKASHSVTLPEGFTGPATVTDGESYTFSVSETDGAYFDYGPVTAEVDGEAVTVTDNGNGTYTIANVTGQLVISGTRTAKSYEVKLEGTAKDDIKDAATTATYGVDYTFTMPTADGFAYQMESLTIGGVDVTDESIYTVDPDTNKYTIQGSAIKGAIEMSISKTATKAGVTVTGSGASAAAGYNVSATIGADYTLTIVPESGWTYVVTATMNGETAEVDNEDNTYTIRAVTGPIVFTVERILKMDGIEVTDYLTIDGSNIWLVKNTVTVNEGKVPTYDGNNMFWSDKYQAYCYLVIKETFTAEDLTGKVNIADGTAVTVDYGMDVNKSGKVDASDAQLTYNIYNAMYSEFTQDVTVEKFLRADVNGDAVVNVEDAAAIITYILEQ